MKWNILPMIRKKRHQRAPESLQDTSDSQTLIFARIAWIEGLLILQFWNLYCYVQRGYRQRLPLERIPH